MLLTFVRISAEDLGDPDLPKTDVSGGADPAERQRVAAVLGLEVHWEQVMVYNQDYRLLSTGCVNPSLTVISRVLSA